MKLREGRKKKRISVEIVPSDLENKRNEGEKEEKSAIVK